MRDARSGYTVSINGGEQTIDRDVRKGSMVLARYQNVFGNSSGGPVVKVIYYDLKAHDHRFLLVGSTAIRRP